MRSALNLDLLNAVASAVLVFSETTVLFVNAAACTLTAYSAETLSTLHLIDLVHPNYKSWLQVWQQNPAPLSKTEMQFVTASGSHLWVEFSIVPFEFEGKHAWLGTAVDITAPKDALQKSEARFHMIMDHMPDTFVIYDSQRQFEFVNKAGITLGGFSEQEMLGRRDEELFPPAITDTYLPALLKTVETRTPQTCDVTVNLRGITITSTVQYVPLLDAQGRIKNILGIAHDITERHKVMMELRTAEAALHEAKQEYDELVANIPGVVYRTRQSPDGHISFDYISPKCRELNGVEADAVLQNAHLLTDQIHPEDRAEFDRLLDESAHNLTLFFWEGRVTVEGQMRWRRLEARPRRLEDGTIIREGIQVDVTAQRQIQERLREEEAKRGKLEKDLEMADTKHKMLEQIHHGLRTPLAVISSALGLLEKYGDRLSESEWHERLDQIHAQAAHLTDMLDDMDETFFGAPM